MGAIASFGTIKVGAAACWMDVQLDYHQMKLVARFL